MFGVVLWSDTQAQSAVIWCEDHGDLAFYRETQPMAPVTLDAGDWVQFDVSLDNKQRKASNPRLVAEGVYPDLADRLTSAAPVRPARVQPRAAPAPRRTADVIPFSGARKPKAAPAIGVASA